MSSESDPRDMWVWGTVFTLPYLTALLQILCWLHDCPGVHDCGIRLVFMTVLVSWLWNEAAVLTQESSDLSDRSVLDT